MCFYSKPNINSLFLKFRTNITILVILIISYIFYTIRRTYKKAREEKWFQKSKNNRIPSENIEAQPARVIFNNQPFNPEVCNTKLFIILSALFCCVAIAGATIGLYVETAFPVIIFVLRFFLSVVGPLIIYANNSALRTFVTEMFIY